MARAPHLVIAALAIFLTATAAYADSAGQIARRLADDGAESEPFGDFVAISGPVDIVDLRARGGREGGDEAPVDCEENQLCGDAFVINPGDTASGNSCEEPGCIDGNASCGQGVGAQDQAVWYTYTATCDASATLSTCQEVKSYDTRLSVHTDCPATPDNEIVCNDDDCEFGNFLSTVNWDVTSGTEYVIRVGAFNDVQCGDFDLTLTEDCYCQPPDCDDGDICTDDSCNDGVCQNHQNGECCEDCSILFPGSGFEFPVGSASLAVTWADLDGDGGLDMVVANSGSDDVSIRLNTCDGTFRPHLTYGAGNFPLSVAIGDLDGDGDLDLAVANLFSDDVSILLNNGDGTFAADVTYGAGDSPNSVVIGDLDRDGDADLTVTNSVDDTVSVLLNIGDGTFAAYVTYGAGDSPRSVAIGDLDGDGDLDLAVANVNSDDISVLLNNGDGTFATHVTYGGGDAPWSIVIGDLDGDGDLDLAVSNISSSDVSVLLNIGDGTFAADVTYGVDGNPNSMAIGDLDGDGDLDLAVAGGSTVSILLNNGDGTLAFAKHLTNGAFFALEFVAIADVDGDGDLDLGVASNGFFPDFFGNVFVLLNNGDGTFGTQEIYGVGNKSRSVAIGDLDGDGDLDLVVASEDYPDFDAEVSVLLNNGDGTFAAHVTYNAGDLPQSVAIGDLDGDLDLDLVVANEDSDDVSVLLNSGDGTFSMQLTYGVGLLAPTSVAIGDLDGDGDLDLAVANYDGDLVLLYNNGSGVFPLNQPLADGSGSRSVAIGDLDGDLDLDLAVANELSGDVSVLLNNGDGTFATHVTYLAGDSPRSVAIGDLDGDGDLDLAVANVLGDDISILLNIGDGTFAPDVTYGVDGFPVSVAIGDLDGDGDLDLATSNVSVLLNNGDGTFAVDLVTYVTGFAPQSVVIGDLDGDGDLDLGVANFGSVSVLLNDPLVIGDSDGDGAPDACDRCPGFDDLADDDGDGVPDGCDLCPGFDDLLDTDGDGIPDGCDLCPGFDDFADADGDGVPDGCDLCPGFDDLVDTDGDGIPDGCDLCPGFDDFADDDGDGVPDGCDLCPGFDDLADDDGDGVPDGCDLCPGFDDCACQIAKLLASDGAELDNFGNSVAIVGTTAIVGANVHDENGSNSGAAYLFDTTTGTQITKLLPDDGAAADNFGTSVAISGTTAIVGAVGHSDDGFASGSAYLFDTTTGTQIAKLLADDAATFDVFGTSVAISGTTAIVGAIFDDGNGTNSGSAYLFDTTTGAQIAKLLPDDGEQNDNFGNSVAITGTIAIVGAPHHGDNGSQSGSAYLFDTTTGAQFAKLLADDGAAGDLFGFSVAISGGTAIVGAQRHDDNGVDTGSAYLFDTATGLQIAKLLAGDGAAGDEFGRSVAISGTTAIVGAWLDDTNSGSAYLFDISEPASPAPIAKLLPDDGAAGDFFGFSVSISGATALVGAKSDDDNGSDSGSAYIFDLTDTDGDGVPDDCDICPGGDDGHECTADSCSEALGCIHEPDDSLCDDGLICNGTERCDPDNGCQPGEPVPDCCKLDVDCDDGDARNGVEVCDLGTNTCVLGTSIHCDDGLVCTLDICDPETGSCSHDPESCEGDANCDGAVNPLDSGFVLARFGCPVGTDDRTCDAADVNGDGNVDPLDSGFVLARFGPYE